MDASQASPGLAHADAAQCAARWWRLLTGAQAIVETPAVDCAGEALAQLSTLALQAERSLLILVPDDEFLPTLSAALDIALRPLCLVLPSADFAARIAMRATLSLLKSRLAREADETRDGPWQAQRRRIDAQPGLWREVQEWNRSNVRRDWPRTTAELFPVRIMPLAAWRALPHQRVDCALCLCCDPGDGAAFLADRLLFVGGRDQAHAGAGVAPLDDTARLNLELAQLTQEVGELELELATAQAEMTEFTHRYYRVVGRRMTELDALRAKLAQHQLAADPGAAPEQAGENRRQQAEQQYEDLRRQAERSQAEHARYQRAQAGAGEEAPPAFRPDAQIKKMFRQLAQRIHPDRASSEADRLWRTQLMSEANRAYRSGDVRALREVALLWAEGSKPAATSGSAAGAGAPVSAAASGGIQDQLRRQIAAMRARFDAIRSELHQLFGSRLYELFLAARQIGRYGRDLLQEMADKLDTQIDEVLAALRALGDTNTAWELKGA